MYQQFTTARAEQHRADLVSSARHARDLRSARPRRRWRTFRLQFLRPARPLAQPTIATATAFRQLPETS